MLLETLDIKKNDVLIYSTNRFDPEANFRIIYKQSSSLKAQPLHFREVEGYIKNPYPKNLVLYRLLTNLQVFDANLTKYGLSILINNGYELVYYDPIFAIKDLEDLRTQIDFNTFRFKIQQIGLSSFGVKQGLYNFSELYSFDLKAEEARNQNDKVFADAIFAFNDSYRRENLNEDELFNTNEKRELHLSEVPNPERRFSKITVKNISPKIDKPENAYRPLSGFINSNQTEKAVPVQENKKSVSDFLHSQKQLNNTVNNQVESSNKESGVLNMFKSVSAKDSRMSEEHVFKAEPHKHS